MNLSEKVLTGRGLAVTFAAFAFGGALIGVLYVVFGRAAGEVPATGLLGDVFPVVFNGLAGVVVGILCAVGEIGIILLTRTTPRPMLGVVGGVAAAASIAIALISIGSMGAHPGLALGGGAAFLILAIVTVLLARRAGEGARK